MLCDSAVSILKIYIDVQGNRKVPNIQRHPKLSLHKTNYYISSFDLFVGVLDFIGNTVKCI